MCVFANMWVSSSTHCLIQVLTVRMVVRRVFEDLPEQQGVFDQPAPGYIQEAPQVQLPTEGRLQAALQEVLHPPVLLLLVQQGLGSQLVTAIVSVRIQTWQLEEDRGIMMRSLHILFFIPPKN